MDRNELKKTAELAMLHVSDEDLDALAGEVEKVLEYMNSMDEVDVSAVEPTAHAMKEQRELREDQVYESPEQRESLLKEAPDREGDHIRIPNVL